MNRRNGFARLWFYFGQFQEQMLNKERAFAQYTEVTPDLSVVEWSYICVTAAWSTFHKSDQTFGMIVHNRRCCGRCKVVCGKTVDSALCRTQLVKLHLPLESLVEISNGLIMDFNLLWSTKIHWQVHQRWVESSNKCMEFLHIAESGRNWS